MQYQYILPLCNLFINHGGFGTMMDGLMNKIPMIIIPNIMDQYIWAQYI